MARLPCQGAVRKEIPPRSHFDRRGVGCMALSINIEWAQLSHPSRHGCVHDDIDVHQHDTDTALFQTQVGLCYCSRYHARHTQCYGSKLFIARYTGQ